MGMGIEYQQSDPWGDTLPIPLAVLSKPDLRAIFGRS